MRMGDVSKMAGGVGLSGGQGGEGDCEGR